VATGAVILNSPCVNCKQAPCECSIEVIETHGVARGQMRRFRFPDGAVLRLDERYVARALAAGAVDIGEA
jgi:hypothetical protein